ncbi:cyclic di-GMP phosphodiesterase response regulator RpfG [Thermoanaerobacter kivui]|uniref:Cyclic di-GMP phosphodiesterase response regulator RpfG n=1 Tax=Thermoanaerobacter kivui TaxID=2325 RepID=A0A097AQP0_THEKI|nr:HD domain-containing phosphohydrolase [Thermoanaerobacter kivui]AIS52149.1 cyclic di-GMP phosphodiesterase response regulator RpfG [Thermoanaerobacter kivui]
MINKRWGALAVDENVLYPRAYSFLERFFPELVSFQELLMHSVRTAKYAFQLSCFLGLGDPQLLFWAGALHDVGKLMVPRHILENPGPLLENQWKIMMQHPLWSFKLVETRCRGTRCLKGILVAIKAHHEAWDGTGYPAGLKGSDIPLEARILALADVFDALTSPRPYRPPLSLGEARKVMTEMVGKKLDPYLFQKAHISLLSFKEEKG